MQKRLAKSGTRYLGMSPHGEIAGPQADLTVGVENCSGFSPLFTVQRKAYLSSSKEPIGRHAQIAGISPIPIALRTGTLSLRQNEFGHVLCR
jgi:hypothetical protein